MDIKAKLLQQVRNYERVSAHTDGENNPIALQLRILIAEAENA